MFRRLGQLYTGVERTYKTIIAALVLTVLVGAGYAGYLACGRWLACLACSRTATGEVPASS